MKARITLSLLFAMSPFTSSAVEDPGFQLPPGFTVELVAGPPLVNHPTMGGFDDKGRLYICDGPGENLPAKELLEKLPNHIRRLEDTDGDGRFDKSTMFADKMTFPMGALWHDGYVYTASPPHIWRLRDTDDDGIADERRILVSEFGFTGNAADIHGCFLGPEGRIYWCDGRHGHNFTDEQGNSLSKGLAARIFSCKPDGSDVRAFAGGGMDNPVEICFTEEGEMLGTVAIFDNKPDRVDAIVHWVYGGAYPYHEKVLGEFKRTGDLLPAVSRFGRVAPSGILRYRGKHLGDEYTNDLFHAQFNTHRVVRTKLTRKGASFTSVDEDFLVSENQDVHLTDVIEDADGSLLVVDTGGWFRIGCPNSQIAKPDILGGIYRIRRTGAPNMDDPRGLTLDWETLTFDELLNSLQDERPAIQDRAKSELVRRSNRAPVVVPALVASDAEFHRAVKRDIQWIASQSSDLLAARLTARGFQEKEPTLIQSALAATAARPKDGLISPSQIIDFLHHSDFAVRREAARIAGLLQHTSLVPAVAEAMSQAEDDRFLEHALIYAMIELGNEEALIRKLQSEDANVRRGALTALDQRASNLLTKEIASKLLDTNDAALLSTALGVMQKHPDWAPAVVDWLKARLANPSLSADQLRLVQNTLLAYKTDSAIQQLLAEALSAPSTSPSMRVALLEVVEQAELTGKQTPADWNSVVTAQLAGADEAVVRQAIAAAKMLGTEAFREPLLAIVRERRGDQSLMIAALKALGPTAGEPDEQTFKVLTDSLTSSSDPLDRLAAADCLSKLPLSSNQRATIVEAVGVAGPLELPTLLGVFDKPGSTGEGQQLAAALAKSPGLANLTVGQVEKLFDRYPREVRSAAEPILHKLNADLASQRSRLAELEAQLDGGDVTRGKNLFTIKKTSCIACHTVKGQGGRIGPDLSNVGQIRSRTDILESILFPSASFVRGFESVAVTTSAGLEVTGILSRETPEAVYIKTAQREEFRVPRKEIDEIAPSKLSIMPTGLDKTLTISELRDLVAYLQTLK